MEVDTGWNEASEPKWGTWRSKSRTLPACTWKMCWICTRWFFAAVTQLDSLVMATWTHPKKVTNSQTCQRCEICSILFQWNFLFQIQETTGNNGYEMFISCHVGPRGVPSKSPGFDDQKLVTVFRGLCLEGFSRNFQNVEGRKLRAHYKVGPKKTQL